MDADRAHRPGARACRVGTMTVSRVVNGGDLVSPKTAARVRAAIEKLRAENQAKSKNEGQGGTS